MPGSVEREGLVDQVPERHYPRAEGGHSDEFGQGRGASPPRTRSNQLTLYLLGTCLFLGAAKSAAAILVCVLNPGLLLDSSAAGIPYWLIVLQIVVLATCSLRIDPGQHVAYAALAASYSLGAGWYSRTPLMVSGVPDIPVQWLLVITLPFLAVSTWRVWGHLGIGLRIGVGSVVAAALLPLLLVLPNALGWASGPLYVRLVGIILYTILPVAAGAVLASQEITRASHRY